MSKSIINFIAVALMSYFLLVGFFKSNFFLTNYSNFWIKTGELVFPDLKNEVSVKYYPSEKEGKHIKGGLFNIKDLDAAFAKAKKLRQTKLDYNYSSFHIDLWLFALIPLAFFISFCIATPFKIKEKIAALCIGLFALHLLFLGKFYTTIFYYSSTLAELKLSAYPSFIQNSLHYYFELIERVGFNIVLSFLIWFSLVLYFKPGFLNFHGVTDLQTKGEEIVEAKFSKKKRKKTHLLQN